MTYTVLGTGAVGGYYGAKLQKGGFAVNFLARSDYGHIRENGLRVESVEGDFSLEKVKVFDSSESLPRTDVVLITMKTTANGYLPAMLEPLVKEGTILFVLQNGLGMEEELKAAFPGAVILGGMCFICSQKTGPGRIAHLDKGSITAAPACPEDSRILERIVGDFTAAGIDISLLENLTEARWKKLLWNVPFNGLSVVLNAHTADIMESPHATQMARRLMEEVIAGAGACGCEIDPRSIEQMLEFTRVMTPYEPSMKLDYNFNRPMEIEYMYRRPIEEARKRGVALPRMEMLADQLSYIERALG